MFANSQPSGRPSAQVIATWVVLPLAPTSPLLVKLQLDNGVALAQSIPSANAFVKGDQLQVVSLLITPEDHQNTAGLIPTNNSGKLFNILHTRPVPPVKS
jgi:hypothetical protein